METIKVIPVQVFLKLLKIDLVSMLIKNYDIVEMNRDTITFIENMNKHICVQQSNANWIITTHSAGRSAITTCWNGEIIYKFM